MLSNKERQELFASSNRLTVKYAIGKDNLTDKAVEMLDKALLANELIKVHVHRNASEEVADFATTLCDKLHCELIKIIGKTIVLYRPSPKKSGK
ncbi:MAG: YhbY family RNA-binding protein [Bacteroidia bacterium]|nr:YhbY family RNA-binding protein [Bacteroidia bacterium]